MVTIFGGALYFQELSSFDMLQGIMFPVGVLVTLAGIVLLSQRQSKQGMATARATVFSAQVL